MNQTAAFTLLEQQGILAVRGVDAGKFLQGQLTCNLDYVSHDRSSLGARCTPKGRMQSSFRLVMQGDGYLLSMQRELVDSQLADLKKFAVFSKSTLLDESQAWAQFGLIGADAALQELGIELAAEPNAVTQHNGMLAIRVTPLLSELWLPAAQAGCTGKKLAGLLEQTSTNHWQLELIRSGIGHVSAPLWESFIPQMINLPALDGVSFKKGCYTGQEIVARMQYLGKQKRQMFRFTTNNPTLPEAGTALLGPDGASKVGEVVVAAKSATGVELLAVTLVDAAAEHGLLLDIADRPQLTPAALPYEIDNEREIQR